MSAGTQMPTLPGLAQVRHAPSQAVWQQTPSTEQNPDPHIAPAVQGCPMAIPPVSPRVPSVPPPSRVVVDPSVPGALASGFRV
jgi:hypothetical protein